MLKQWDNVLTTNFIFKSLVKNKLKSLFLNTWSYKVIIIQAFVHKLQQISSLKVSKNILLKVTNYI